MNKFLYRDWVYVFNANVGRQRADLRHLHAGVTARVDALEGAEIHRHIQGGPWNELPLRIRKPNEQIFCSPTYTPGRIGTGA